jgi:hypothetical protein
LMPGFANERAAQCCELRKRDTSAVDLKSLHYSRAFV